MYKPFNGKRSCVCLGAFLFITITSHIKVYIIVKETQFSKQSVNVNRLVMLQRLRYRLNNSCEPKGWSDILTKIKFMQLEMWQNQLTKHLERQWICAFQNTCNRCRLGSVRVFQSKRTMFSVCGLAITMWLYPTSNAWYLRLCNADVQCKTQIYTCVMLIFDFGVS